MAYNRYNKFINDNGTMGLVPFIKIDKIIIKTNLGSPKAQKSKLEISKKTF